MAQDPVCPMSQRDTLEQCLFHPAAPQLDVSFRAPNQQGDYTTRPKQEHGTRVPAKATEETSIAREAERFSSGNLIVNLDMTSGTCSHISSTPESKSPHSSLDPRDPT
ncbi:hypothetical protein H696_02472 [Fonticula alba]|uniref:Uncharacterized protein n=1 Tax=Fonticula alba TaxID=691883 RepID=A0A058ZDK0_FONAL|nr:hypothetical protein H696_02472 [Fonticula alba]KCV71537.1 hypothetical protein H696_02472 [Fonticula alba]|eukprot:XP_009494660.1 hypothetical protein H696_02472 [Fonticula alba]